MDQLAPAGLSPCQHRHGLIVGLGILRLLTTVAGLARFKGPPHTSRGNAPAPGPSSLLDQTILLYDPLLNPPVA